MDDANVGENEKVNGGSSAFLTACRVTYRLESLVRSKAADSAEAEAIRDGLEVLLPSLTDSEREQYEAFSSSLAEFPRFPRPSRFPTLPEPASPPISASKTKYAVMIESKDKQVTAFYSQRYFKSKSNSPFESLEQAFLAFFEHEAISKAHILCGIFNGNFQVDGRILSQDNFYLPKVVEVRVTREVGNTVFSAGLID